MREYQHRSGQPERKGEVVRVVVHVQSVAQDDQTSQALDRPVLAEEVVEEGSWAVRHIEESRSVEREVVLGSQCAVSSLFLDRKSVV